MLPTWLFVACMLAAIALGMSKAVAQGGHPAPLVPAPHVPATLSAASPWLLKPHLRAVARP